MPDTSASEPWYRAHEAAQKLLQSRVGDDLFDQIEFDVTLFAVTTSPTRTKKDAIPAD
jgi:hypothetical protein